jgi:activator of 2-hydroxyglutaryl-CoA dehydratase
MKIKEASMVTTAVMFLIAIATFFVGKVSSKKSERNHKHSQERKIDEVISKYRQKNELEKIQYEQKLKDALYYYENEGKWSGDYSNIPAQERAGR